MNSNQLKTKILQLSFGGVMYDISEGSELNTLVREFDRVAVELADSIDENNANGIDKGVKNFITEVLA